MRNVLVRTAVFAIVAIACAGMLRAESDPVIGTWALNVAKSKYTPGPPPQKEVRTYAAAGHGMNVKVQSTGANGAQVNLNYFTGDDGKDSPLSGLATGNGISMKRLGARTFEADTKKDGKVIGTTMGEVSTDGKLLTLTFKTTGPGGKAILNVAVYEKQ